MALESEDKCFDFSVVLLQTGVVLYMQVKVKWGRDRCFSPACQLKGHSDYTLYLFVTLSWMSTKAAQGMDGTR